jgi:poly(3-hydroxybutyrate) depolymerase
MTRNNKSFLCAAMLLGCAGKPMPGSPSQAASQDVGSAPTVELLRFDVEGVERTALVQLPVGHTPGEPLAAVVTVHAHAPEQGDFGGYTMINRWEHVAEPLLVVHANGRGGRWIGPSGRGDVAYFDRLVDALDERYALDEEALAVVGEDAGATMVWQLSYDRSDTWSAFAAVGRGMPWALGSRTPLVHRPLLLAMGTEDGDQAQGDTHDFVETDLVWRATWGIDEPASEALLDATPDGTQVLFHTYPRHAQYMALEIIGGNDRWPGHGADARASQEIDMALEVLDFFYDNGAL